MELWITCAEDDDCALDALILGTSLARSFTNRKKMILIGESVSNSMRIRLWNVFEGVLKIQKKGSGFDSLDFNLFAKIYSLSLPFIRKCVFLEPSILMMRNFDEIFEMGGNDGKCSVVTRMGLNEKRLEIPLIFLSPSMETFDQVSRIFLTERHNNGATLEQYLVKFLADQKGFFPIDQNLLLGFAKDSMLLRGDRTEAAMVQFISGRPSTTTNYNLSISNDFQNTIILEYWESVFSECMLDSFHYSNITGYNFHTHSNEPIAIIGVSCRLPGSNNLSEFWELLINGQEAIRKVPEDRWTQEQSCIVDSEGRKVEAGFLNCPVDHFDGGFFGMSPMELAYTDPQHRFLLEVAWEALEDAAIDPTSLQGSSTGIFTGIWRNEYGELMTKNGYPATEYRAYMGNSLGAAGGRLAHVLGATGSNVATESGCSSSMVAVGLACKSLRRNECDLALACGVNLLLHPFTCDNFKMVISPRGRCRTFDADADGFGRAEGCAVLVLKRLSQAVRDEDRVYAIIRGYGESQEGPSSNLGTPTIKGEALAMEMALEDANVDPKDVTYLEAHGTGTRVGDPIEMDAIANVYSPGRIEPLVVGSVKTNVGHTESVSGITGIIKTILSLQNETIPPHRNLEILNPRIDLHKIPAIIPSKPTPWTKTKDGKLRLAGISSFGLTGTDSHLIIQETPKLPKNQFSSEIKYPYNILTLSAKSEEALDELLASYKKYLEHNSKNLSHIAFTANTGRAHFNHRVAIIAKDSPEILQKIQKRLIENGSSVTKPKICFLFTGQGSQYQTMGKTLYKLSPVFRKQFDKCANILSDSYNISIRDVLWEENGDKLNESLYSQTSIFCIEYSLTKLWESWGITPDIVLGHSLGEFAASVAAGILTLESALKLVAERSRLINTLPRGKMMVIRTNKNTLTELTKTFEHINQNLQKNYWIDVAAINSNEQITIAGSPDSITAFEIFCKNNGIKTHTLESSHSFHSRDMEPILEEYESIAKSVTYSTPKCQYISGVYGKLLEGKMDAKYWVRQTRDKVNFQEASIQAFERSGAQTFLEIGPQPVLLALVKRNLHDFENNGPLLSYLPSMRKNENEWSTILNSLAKLYVNGATVNWKEFHRFQDKEKITLPFYPFQRKKYWFEPKHPSSSLKAHVGQQLHPIIGTSLINATENKIFEGCIDINGKDAYVKDHVVGKHIIFPGAGYLEMCVAARFYANNLTKKDISPEMNGPIVVDNLLIKAPLGAKEFSGPKQIQTVVSGDGKISNTIKIFSSQEGPNSEAQNTWICHATAESQINTPQEKAFDIVKHDFKEIQERLTPIPVTDLYQIMDKLGYHFGPTFCSVNKLWRNDSSGEILSLISTPVTTDVNPVQNGYFTHPILIDAMLQTLLIGESVIKTLHVPISVGRFVWVSKSHSKETNKLYYVHITRDLDLKKTAVLYDEQGEILAILKDVQFIETNLEKLNTKLETEQTYPPIFKEEWRKTETMLGVNLCKSLLRENDDTLTPELVISDDNTEAHELIYRKEMEFLNTANCLGIIKCLRHLGWNESVGQEISPDFIIQKYGIKSDFKMLVARFLEIFCEDDYIEHSSTNGRYKVIREFPTVSEIHDGISQNVSSLNLLKCEWDLASLCLDNFTEILQGKLSPLPIIFDEADAGIHGDYYNKAETYVKISKLLGQTFEQLLIKIKEQLASINAHEIRILEIGAGTGSATIELLPLLEKHGIKYKYLFTDISAAFFTNAQKRFKTYNSKMEFQVLNIERDPLAQGFAPNQYDIIVAAHVLHATTDLAQTCFNAKTLLKSPFGLILMAEVFTPQRFLDTTFGLLDGFWRFSDFNLRPSHCLANEVTWETVLSQAGFSNTKFIKLPWRGVIISEAVSELQIEPSQGLNSKDVKTAWLIFSNEFELSKKLQQKLEKCNRLALQVSIQQDTFEFIDETFEKTRGLENSNEEIIKNHLELESIFDSVTSKVPSGNVEGIVYLLKEEKNTYDSEHTIVCKQFLDFIQNLVSHKPFQKSLPKLFVITEGQIGVEDQEPKVPYGAQLWAFARTLRGEIPTMFCRCIDVDPNEQTSEIADQIFLDFWNHQEDFQIAYRQGSRHVSRLVSFDPKDTSLTLPQSERFALKFPASKEIADLTFEKFAKLELKGKEVEVQVKACGLNFRDIFTVMKPIEHFNEIKSLASDFSGVVTSVGPEVTSRKVGDAVIGVNHWWAMPSHVRLLEDEVIPLPDNLAFTEGATLPVAFATAYLCLITYGQLRQNETVLIHTGSGAVGIIAIQIAQSIGARVIATAGSYRKRAYLRSIGVSHVFNSRNLNFGQEIKTLTVNNGGVDLIVNSLTSEGFKETSLELCRPNATFVEMSLLNIWTEEEVKALRPDVKYFIVNITWRDEIADLWKSLLKRLSEFLDCRKISPIPHTRFYAANVQEALTYLKKAEHIGKVVCTMPELEFIKGKYEKGSEFKHNLFNHRSTYLITGGLGGIGIAVAKWMSNLGAKHIVLCGRHPPTQNISDEITKLERSDINIIVIQADVGELSQCHSILNSISQLKLPKLRGIMHAAGALSDALIVNQTWSKFKIALNAKVNGAWNLHTLTIDHNLEHFVMFSSIACTLGCLGQSNHAAANGFMDSLAHYRHNLGLSATTINWGQWGEIGVAADIDIPGLTPFAPNQAFNTLEYAMSRQELQLHVAQINVSQWKKEFPWTKHFLGELKVPEENNRKAISSIGQSDRAALSSNNFWEEVDATTSGQNRHEAIQKHVGNVLSIILKIDPTELNVNQNFQEMGLDSLMNIELRNLIQNLLGNRVKLSMTSLVDCNTISLMTDRLIEVIYHNEESDKLKYRIARRNLIHEDSILPSHIKVNEPSSLKPSEIHTVLLTGGTGNLGPYLLKNLTNRSQITKVYCLVRDRKEENGMTRLVNSLKTKGLLESTQMSKVEIVSGDVTLSNLGLSSPLHKKLTLEVDAVVNCAVKSNHLEEYRKTVGNDTDVRTVNVLGTLNVLQFATCQRTKYIFHASSMIGVMKGGQNGRMPECWPSPDEFDEGPNMGYAISKFISDRLLSQAVQERNIPAKVFRFPIICGDKFTGNQAIAENHFFVRYLCYLKCGIVPTLDIPLVVLPVNDCADIALDIFFIDEAPPGIYNVVNPHVQREEDIVQLGKDFRRTMTLVPYKDFVQSLVQDGEKSLLYLLQEFYTDEERHLKLLSEMTLLNHWRENRKNFFEGGKAAEFLPGLKERLEMPLDIIKRDVNFALKCGFVTFDD